ncbi:MAG: M28 family peptidase [Promethearchaeota archaeon]
MLRFRKKSTYLLIIFMFINSINFSHDLVQNVDAELLFEGQKALVHVRRQVEMGPRIPGSKESKSCLSYFIREFDKIDDDYYPIFQEFIINNVSCRNLLFKLNPQKPNIVILATHFDTRARATKDDFAKKTPVPGANDGASGCAVLLELARVLQIKEKNLECQVWFLFFDAEDQGYDVSPGIEGWDWCEGSKIFAEHIDAYHDPEHEYFDCLILLDMVGGINLQFIKEQKSTPSLLEEIFEIGRGLDFTDVFPENPNSASVIDDHDSFLELGIPSVDLIINFWNNPDWPYHHTTRDDLTSISKKSLEITGKTVEQFLYNNYLYPLNKSYQGYKPWKFPYYIPYHGTLLLLMCFLAGIFSLIVISYYFKKSKKKGNNEISKNKLTKRGFI